MNKLSISDLDLTGKRVFMRVDFNVPIADGRITDDTRIEAALPSIKYVIEKGGRLILASHLGRPKGKPDPKYSLKVVSTRLSELLHKPVQFAPDCIGPEVQRMATALKNGMCFCSRTSAFMPKRKRTILRSRRNWPPAVMFT